MFEHFGNLMDAVKRVQQYIDQTQAQLKEERITLSSGDAIKVTVDGQQNIVSIELAPKYLSPENAVLLQDLLVATINGALAKSRDLQQAAMAKLASDLNLPKIPGLF